MLDHASSGGSGSRIDLAALTWKYCAQLAHRVSLAQIPVGFDLIAIVNSRSPAVAHASGLGQLHHHLRMVVTIAFWRLRY